MVVITSFSARADGDGYCKSCTCSMVLPAINLGSSINPLLNQAYSTINNIVITCSSNEGSLSDFSLTLKLTAGNSGNFSGRYMLKGQKRLNYNIYSNTGYTRILGDASASTVIYSTSLRINKKNSPQVINVPLYSMLPAQLTAEPGVFSDTIVATLNFSVR